MPSLTDLHQMIAGSSPYDDWKRIPAWGANAAPVASPFLNPMNHGEHGQVDGWYIRNYSDLLVHLPEVDLSIAYGLAPDPEEKDNRRHFDWAEARDWDVQLTYTDIRWRGAVVDRLTMWSIDEGRGVVPVGRRPADSDVLYVEPWTMAVAGAIAVVHGTHGDLDFCFQATGQRLR